MAKLGDPDLDDLVRPGGEQVPGGGFVVYVHDAVLAVVKARCRRSAGSHTTHGKHMEISNQLMYTYERCLIKKYQFYQ